MASTSNLASRAFRLGWRRVATAPTLVGGVWLLSVLTALPAAWGVHTAVAEHVRSSLVATRIAAGPDEAWWGEFLAQARGAARTLQPEVIGAAASLSNLSKFLDGRGVSSTLAAPALLAPPPALVATLALSFTTWLFLTGGLIDRYARGRRLGSRAFFGACGVFFFRFIRLGVLVGLGYWLLAGPYHSLLFDVVYPWLTRETPAERVAFVWRIALYLAWLAPLVLLNLATDSELG